MKTVLDMSNIRIGTILGTRNTFAPLAWGIGKAQAEYGGMIGRRARMISTHSLCAAQYTQTIFDHYPEHRNGLAIGQFVGIEATWPKCRIVPFSKYEHSDLMNHYCYVANVPGSEKFKNEINDFLWQVVGRPYELKVFLKMLFAPWMKLRPGDWYCSEVVYGRFKVQRNYDHPPEWVQGVTPWDIQRHSEAANLIDQRFYDRKMLFPD